MPTLNPTTVPRAPGKPLLSKRYAAETRVFPVLQARGLLPAGTITRGASVTERALGHNWLLEGLDGAVHSLACRIRWGGREYGAFTVRYKTGTGKATELTSRVRSINAGGVYPGFTIQAEMTDEGDLLQAYVVRTDELYRHFIRMDPDGEHFTVHECTQKHPYRAPGGAQFFVVAINELGRTMAATRSSLITCGVGVRSLVPRDEGMVLGL